MKFNILHLFLLLFLACQQDLPLGAVEPCPVDSPKYDKAVILVMGQSNAANFSDKIFSSSCTNTYNFYNGELFPLKDPLQGANGSGGSVWTPMASMLMESNFANELIIVPVAVGGTKIEQWIPSGELNSLIQNALDDLNTINLEITHVLWHQGESNNSLLNTTLSAEQNALSYKANLQLLIDYLRSEQIGAPIFIAQTTRCGYLTPDLYLQAAQSSLSEDSLNIFNGPNTDLLGPELRYDQCHFNENGTRLHALLWANILLNHP